MSVCSIQGGSLLNHYFKWLKCLSILLHLWPLPCKNKMLAFPSILVLLFQEKTRGWQLGGSIPTGPFLLPISNELPSDSKKLHSWDITTLPPPPPPALWSLLPCSNKKDSRTSRIHKQYLLSCKSQRMPISSMINPWLLAVWYVLTGEHARASTPCQCYRLAAWHPATPWFAC